MWLKGGTGSNTCDATFIGCSFQGGAPTTDDEMVVYSGHLTFIGCLLSNGRDYWVSLPRLVINYIKPSNLPGGLTLMNCFLRNVEASGANSEFVRDAQAIYGGGSSNIIATGDAKFTMINCMGGQAGSLQRLPTIVPPFSRWQNTALYNPPSVPAGGVVAAGTVSVPGAAMGDLVEASFSLSLQGLQLNAWVSTADTVTYQLFNPTSGAIALSTGGTVKCRVKK
jgi:hypothetical protein